MGICVVSTRLMWISQDDTMYTRGASWLALKCYSTQDLTGVPVPWCDVTRPQPGTDYSPPCLSKGVLLLFDYIEGELLKWKETPKCTLGGGIIPADLLRPCRNFSVTSGDHLATWAAWCMTMGTLICQRYPWANSSQQTYCWRTRTLQWPVTTSATNLK